VKVEIEAVHMDAVHVLRHEIVEDERGFFHESFRADVFAALGLPTHFPQENHSRSVRGVLRGLHFQWDPPIGKLMRVTLGHVVTVAVDLRKGSPTLGRWVMTELDTRSRRQVWAPAGFARGFYVLSEVAEVQYKCTGIWNPAAESGIRWNDPDLAIDWPLQGRPLLSDKDAGAQTLAQWLARPESDHFVHPDPPRGPRPPQP
jgi:dTDP-4-dehydrorhamnose 3,5-epimerase